MRTSAKDRFEIEKAAGDIMDLAKRAHMTTADKIIETIMCYVAAALFVVTLGCIYVGFGFALGLLFGVSL
jgi:hypothetical protein